MRRLNWTEGSGPQPTVLTECADMLLSGGVVVIPTETVYGLVTLWNNTTGRQRIYDLKRRPSDKRLQMLAVNVASACVAGVLSDARLEVLARAFWPGPVTVVCRAAADDTVGLRVPNHEFVLALLRELKQPLAATSANRSGRPAADTAAAAVADLDGTPDLLVDSGQVVGEASTVVSLVRNAPELLREGPVLFADILTVLATAPAAADPS